LGVAALLPLTLRTATVEDVRDALAKITEGLSDATASQYVLRVKSLLTYAHKLGFTPFNGGVTIKVRAHTSSRGASIAKRILTETEVALLIRAARTKRDRVLIEVAYAGGLRVSELVGLSWADVLPRDKGQVQLAVMGKGRKQRQVLLPDAVREAARTGLVGAQGPRRYHAGERLQRGGFLLSDEEPLPRPRIWLRRPHREHAQARRRRRLP
jgi:integrase/recombinase XerD